MKVFVTGGSGFIGSHVVRQLLERGDDVYGLARSKQSADFLTGLGATAVRGDVNDVDSMREAMRGSDIVFHIAGWYKIGADDWVEGEIVNVGGTRRVLKLAYELGVPRIIYTSTVGIFGDTKGQLVDESYYYDGSLATEYERTKWLAHYKVALPLIEQGAPIIIVMPGATYGPGDPSTIGDLMQRFYLNHAPFPLLPGPTTVLTYAHVADVAAGHLLAAEKGKVGESYILAGPPVPLGEMVDFWARLTGKKRPSFHIPAALIRSLAPLMNTVNQLVDLPATFSADAMRVVGTTYMASADKAKTELGWRPRSIHRGMLETLGHIAAEAESRPMPVSRFRVWRTTAIIFAVVALILWLLLRNRRSQQ